MLIEAGQLPPQARIACPSSSAATFAYYLPDRDATGHLHGLVSGTNHADPDTMPIMGDGPQAQTHGRGFNVLFLGGMVRFCTDPNVGIERDHIYVNDLQLVRPGSGIMTACSPTAKSGRDAAALRAAAKLSMFSRDAESSERTRDAESLVFSWHMRPAAARANHRRQSAPTVHRHGERDAFVFRAQHRRLSYREFWDLTTRCAQIALGSGRASRRSRRHLVAESLRVAGRAICHRSHRRHSRQCEPVLQTRTSWNSCCGNPARRCYSWRPDIAGSITARS